MRVIAALTLFFALWSGSVLADCQSELASRLSTDLTLSYQAFDQTEQAGFRILGQAGCYKEAAALIAAYIEHNNSKDVSLTWHLAQMEGLAGNYQQAIKHGKAVLNEHEDLSVYPMYWNDYVLGNIAFWQRDKQQLQTHIQNVRQGEHFKPNAINLRYLEKLSNNFELSYLEAISGT